MPIYVVNGAGDAIANGAYLKQNNASFVSATGWQLFLYETKWYIGKAGTGPLLYEGACSTEHGGVPTQWVPSTWNGTTSKLPAPSIGAASGAPAPVGCPAACVGYMLKGAGTASVNGCYHPAGLWSFNNTATSAVMYRAAGGKWFIGAQGKTALAVHYSSTCDTSVLPPAEHGWTTAYVPHHRYWSGLVTSEQRTALHCIRIALPALPWLLRACVCCLVLLRPMTTHLSLCAAPSCPFNFN